MACDRYWAPACSSRISDSFCVVPVEKQSLKSLESVQSVEDSRASCVDLS